MDIPDLVNGLFELFGGMLILLNIRALLRDKQIRGVHWGPTVFFTAWGLWNLFYYPHLGQWFSFVGGVLIVLVNSLWLYLVFWYSRGKP